MVNLLTEYKQFHAFNNDLVGHFGNDLINAKTEQKELVYCEDVVAAIKKYRNGEILLDAFIDWVNTLWFTELYEYADNQSDSIASVMTALEILDEEGVEYTEEEFSRMIKALENNTEFV